MDKVKQFLGNLLPTHWTNSAITPNHEHDNLLQPPSSSTIDSTSLSHSVGQDEQVKALEQLLQQHNYFFEKLDKIAFEQTDCHLNVVVLGTKKSGKTSFVQQFVDHVFSPLYQPSSKTNTLFRTKFLVDHQQIKSIKLKIWDGDYTPVNTISQPHAVFILYNICDKQSFEEIPTILEQVKQKYCSKKAKIQPFGVALIGTHLDLTCSEEETKHLTEEEREEDAREVTLKQVQQCCRKAGLLFEMEISNKDSTKVEHAFFKMLRYCMDFHLYNKQEFSDFESSELVKYGKNSTTNTNVVKKVFQNVQQWIVQAPTAAVRYPLDVMDKSKDYFQRMYYKMSFFER